MRLQPTLTFLSLETMRLRRPMTAALFEFDIDHPGLVSGIAVRASAELAARGSTVDNREFGGNCLGSSRDNLLLWRLGREKKRGLGHGGSFRRESQFGQVDGGDRTLPDCFFLHRGIVEFLAARGPANQRSILRDSFFFFSFLLLSLPSWEPCSYR